MDNNTNLSMVVLPKEAWEGITSEIQSLKTILQGKTEQEESEKWLDSSVARKMLGVSQKTWQTYRDNRIIPFCQFGRKIFVKKCDIEAFRKQHYVSK